MQSPRVLEAAHTLRQFVQAGVENIREDLEGTECAAKFDGANVQVIAESIFDAAHAVVKDAGVPEESSVKVTLVLLAMQGLAAYCMVCGIDPETLREPRNPLEELMLSLGIDPSALGDMDGYDDDDD